MSRPLNEVFEDVLRGYPAARRDEKFGRSSSFWPLVYEVRETLGAVPLFAGSRRSKLKVSFGQGAWAEVPNFAMMDTRETERPSSGLYMVYLVRADGSGLVLSLNQGSADLMYEARSRLFRVLRKRAEHIRSRLDLEKLGAAGFDHEAVELASDKQYPKAYAAGSIVAKTYNRGAVPVESELLADLETLHAAYMSVIPSSKLGLREVAPVSKPARRWRP